MKLNASMNFIDIGRWIIEQIEDGKGRTVIEGQLRRKFEWEDAQVFSATDPYFEEKRYTPRTQRVKRA